MTSADAQQFLLDTLLKTVNFLMVIVPFLIGLKWAEIKETKSKLEYLWYGLVVLMFIKILL